MPTARRKDESEKDFISRCMSEVKDEFPDQSQRYAVCKSYSDKSTKMTKQEEIFVLKPKKTENRGMYLTRCSNHPKIKSQFGNIKERMGFCLSSFNEYYSYWAKLEDFAEVPKDTALGECIAREKAKGFDYREAYQHCASKVVVKPQGGTNPVVMKEDDSDLIVEPVEFAEMDVLGYPTKHFEMCPGAQATFEHLISMGVDEETSGMIRSAAQVADNIFEIEKKVIEDEEASPEQLKLAQILVQDFYDIMEEIDEESGMMHDVSYMDGHIEKISSYL